LAERRNSELGLSSHVPTDVRGAVSALPPDGKVVKLGDDLLSATRYAVTMLRRARTAQAYDNFRRKIEYQNLALA
jgi:hypothetical protein